MNQLDRPSKGDTVAVMHTSMGDISIRLFPDKTPKTCENFMTHAKNGYYNGLIFHRVIQDFMIQGGDPLGNGTGGESIWGEPVEDEPNVELRNYCGALSMANAGPNTNGSQFFIVQLASCPKQMLDQIALKDKRFPESVVQNYNKVGGTPWLDFRHTVFGQVYDGMDVVNAIANTPTGRNDKPEQDVTIQSIEISVLD
ncbi:MAG TPA: peptidylprolyl isomerase [Ruminococcaceae bacterium]|nr:peptidylprolyl isomerase [Oscillospiraceae bacterium]